jgi:hypothetical protein
MRLVCNLSILLRIEAHQDDPNQKGRQREVQKGFGRTACEWIKLVGAVLIFVTSFRRYRIPSATLQMQENTSEGKGDVLIHVA